MDFDEEIRALRDTVELLEYEIIQLEGSIGDLYKQLDDKDMEIIALEARLEQCNG